MDLSFSPAEESFRAELRTWLTAHLPASWASGEPPEFASLADEVAFLRDWQRRLADGRWVGIHWPREYGGRGASVIESYVFQEEMAAARAPEIINRIGVNLVGPTLIAHGTDAQRRRFLPRILPAEELWCQLFSEPGAGSDLTALRTRAEPRSDGWVLNGQKVWTSYAQFARWGILLARTDSAAPKAKGISYLICDMQAPGVTVRPLRQMTGGEEFNEVFLEDVFIPREHLVGREHDGWSIANTTLAHERGTSPRQLVIHRMLLNDLLRLAREERDGTAPAADPVLRQRIAQHVIDVEITRLNNWRTLTRLQKRLPLGSGVELHQALLERDEPAHARHRDEPARSARAVLAARPVRGRRRPPRALVPLLSRGEPVRRHVGDPAQHPRGACAGPSSLALRRPAPRAA